MAFSSGRLDLSIDLGAPGELNSPRVRAVIGKIASGLHASAATVPAAARLVTTGTGPGRPRPGLARLRRRHAEGLSPQQCRASAREDATPNLLPVGARSARIRCGGGA